MYDVDEYNKCTEMQLFTGFSKKISAVKKNLSKGIVMGTKMCQGESCYGLGSHSTWSVCVCMCVRLHLCMCVRLHLCMCEAAFMFMCEISIMYLCETSFMYLCEIDEFYTLSNEEMTKIKVIDLDEFYNFYIHVIFS
jgi:hypothetical protein